MKISEKEMCEYLRKQGYGVVPPDQYRIDMEDAFLELWETAAEYTMTSVERGYALYRAVRYIIDNDIPGDFVECGVWKGGSCMLIAGALKQCGAEDRRLYLYDTFEGMTEPGEHDFIAWNGKSVKEKWDEDKAGRSSNFTGWAVGIEKVRNNLLKTGYPEENIFFIKGPVEQTLTDNKPRNISLLRLDTDWYESTMAELVELYPLLVRSGVLILDDYGHFTGAKKAVDDYFRDSPEPVLLNRIDYTGRISIKI